MMHEFLGPFFLALIAGMFFFCCVRAFVEYVEQFRRAPAAEEREVRR